MKTYTCTVENCPANTKTESIAKAAHTEVVDEAIAASCLASGKTEGKHCSVCGTVIVAQEETKPLGHDFTGNYSSDADGHWHKCSRCNVTEEKAAHAYPENTDCTKAVNCTACGYTKPAGEHSWDTGEVTTAATCTVNGVKTYTCRACKQTKTENINALGHDFASDFTVDKAATGTETGSKSKHCSRCDAKVAVTEIPATGHAFAMEWSTDADYHWYAATCGHTMVSEKSEHTWNGDTCAVCGRTKTEDASQGRVCNIRFEQKNDHFQLAWDALHNAESLNNPRYYIYLQKNDSWVEVGRTKQTLLSYPVDEAGDYTAVWINTTVENDSGRTVLASCEQAVDFKVSFTVGDAPASVTWSKNEESTYDECVTGVTPNVWGVLRLRTSSSEHSSGRLTGEDGVWTAAVDSDSMEKYLASGEYRFLEYLDASVSDNGLTASYTVNQRGKWTACSSESATEAWITATNSNLKLEWTPKDGYNGLYYVNGTNVGPRTTYSLLNTARNAAQNGTYSFTISTKEDASSNTLTPYVTLENALTVSIDTTKTPNVTIRGLENGNYKFESQNGFTGMYGYDLCAPDGSVIHEWWVKAGSTVAPAPYTDCKFKVRELSWTAETGKKLPAVTVSASAEGTFGFTSYDFSAIQTNVTDESAFSTAVNKGGKVILENDITITNTQINRGGDVEIDLNGHKLDLGSSNSLAISKAVKFTDSSADKAGIIAGTSGIRCDAGSKLNLNGITVARITDAGKMRGITIENCKVTYLIQLTYVNEMDVVNTDFSGDVQVKIYNSTAFFNECTFAGGSDQNILQLNGNTKVMLDNATFSSGKVSPTGSGNELILKSGTYCFNPTEYVPEGYTVVHDEENSVWTVSASA